MPAHPRKELVNPSEIGFYHCTSRCVRRAFLCGFDSESNKTYEYRKLWLKNRVQLLASIFGIDVCGYAIMSNHYHLVLRIRPDLARNWSDEEVAERWLLVKLAGRSVHIDHLESPVVDRAEIAMIISDPAKVAEYRRRLMSISVFMAQINEPIARAANREDKLKGRFWESRFYSQQLLDEAAFLACSMYVDLNPIRAGIAAVPEESKFTSAYDRIHAFSAESQTAESSGQGVDATVVSKELVDVDVITCLEAASVEEIRIENSEPCASIANKPCEAQIPMFLNPPDSWLCKLTLDEGPDVLFDDGCPISASKVEPIDSTEVGPEKLRIKPPARASNRGLLPISIEKYLSLLDWTGRSIRENSKGSIPADLAPILERLGLNGDHWIDTIKNFGRMFKRASGKPISLRDAAKRSGQLWFQGASSSKIAFI